MIVSSGTHYSFYRYYTTKYCAQRFVLLSTTTIIKYFSIYVVLYHLFITNTYLLFYPAVILVHQYLIFGAMLDLLKSSLIPPCNTQVCGSYFSFSCFYTLCFYKTICVVPTKHNQNKHNIFTIFRDRDNCSG